MTVFEISLRSKSKGCNNSINDTLYEVTQITFQSTSPMDLKRNYKIVENSSVKLKGLNFTVVTEKISTATKVLQGAILQGKIPEWLPIRGKVICLFLGGRIWSRNLFESDSATLLCISVGLRGRSHFSSLSDGESAVPFHFSLKFLKIPLSIAQD